MRLLPTIAFGLALSLCACAHLQERTLYDQLGGKEGVEQIVELLLTRISDDPRIASQFAAIDILNLNDKLIEQICFESGGPCTYTGKGMAEAHAQLKVTNADFNALVEDLDLRIEASAALAEGKPARPMDPTKPIENWRAEAALFLLGRRSGPVEPDAAPGDLFGA